MQSHKVGNFMTHDDVLALDLILDVKMWSIKLLMEKGLNIACMFDVPSGTLHVRCQRPYKLVKH